MYLRRCLPDSDTPIYGVVSLDNTGADRSAYDPSWGCVGHDKQFAVAPGVTRVDTLHLKGPWGVERGSGRPLGRFEGRMQLTYQVAACRVGCGVIDDAGRVSNPFLVNRW